MDFVAEDRIVISSADEAAQTVLGQAMCAAAQGTFAVGGCIIENATGRLIHKMHNNVLKPLKNSAKTFTYDPTAHGERQLVYWYYENRHKLHLPDPDKLTVITTLDPCVMCTGALLKAGFNVGVIALDDFAGINYDYNASFRCLPLNLRDLAKTKFGYFACGKREKDPSIFVRDYVGGADVAFNYDIVAAERLMGCSEIFQACVNKVRESSSDAGLVPSKLSDPANLSDDSPIKKQFRAIYPDAFRLKVPNARLPNLALYQLLKSVKESKPNAANAVALLDPFGNVVICLPDTFDDSPIHTAFMNVTRSYAITRYELMNNEDTRQEAVNHLTHPKYGTFVFLYAPNPSDATTIMTLGAYGSTMEGPIPETFPSNLQYFHPPLKGTAEELRTVIMGLPPFYTQLVQVAAMEVTTNLS